LVINAADNQNHVQASMTINPYQGGCIGFYLALRRVRCRDAILLETCDGVP
jgi:hypothetical protein